MVRFMQQDVQLGVPVNNRVSYGLAIGWNVPIVLNDWDRKTATDYELGILSNNNIKAQKGLFILNPTLRPLENYFDGLSPATDPSEFRQSLYYGKMMCFDISTRLIPTIRTHLNKNGITQQKLFPNSNSSFAGLIRKKLQELKFELLAEVKNERL